MEERPDKHAPPQTRLAALQSFVARVGPGGQGSTARLDAAAAQALAELEQAGIDALLLKGSGLGMLLYGPGGHRSFSDVDLLVAPAQLAAAENALARLGYFKAGADQEIDDIGGVVHAHTWIRIATPVTGDPQIDLHHRLPGARADPALAWNALLARRTWIELGGRPAPVLDRAGQAMQLATHAAQHGPAVIKHVDELELALAVWPAAVWRSAAQLASEIGATDAFAAGLRLSPRGAALATALGLPATDELDWSVRHRGERPRGTFHLEALVEAQTARQHLDVLRRSLLPNPAWIVHEHPWARMGGWRVPAAYGLHVVTAPVWAARAWRFRRRVRRAGGLR